MFIDRLAKKVLMSKIQPGKVVLLYGPRRVGKTTLLNDFIQTQAKETKIKSVNGETHAVQDALSVQNVESLRRFIGDSQILIVDEAQQIPNIGQSLKLIVDTFSNVAVIASGSASFSLVRHVGEPLTGRQKTNNMFPVSAAEITQAKGTEYFQEALPDFLVYGTYPELFTIADRVAQADYLRELVNAYLFKDILELDNVRDAKKIRDLLTLLAFQIGKEVSLTELGVGLEMNKKTVARYLDLLEKAFVIVNIRGFSRNLRKEVTKMSRYYFYDNGIRNALINNFNALALRDDIGPLWENYLVMERLKKQSYTGLHANNYFWRTYNQKEIDWVEEREGKLFGYEFKWGTKKGVAPTDWLKAYTTAVYQTVNIDNFVDFIV